MTIKTVARIGGALPKPGHSGLGNEPCACEYRCRVRHFLLVHAWAGSAFQQPVYRYSIRRSHSGAEANNGASKAK